MCIFYCLYSICYFFVRVHSPPKKEKNPIVQVKPNTKKNKILPNIFFFNILISKFFMESEVEIFRPTPNLEDFRSYLQRRFIIMIYAAKFNCEDRYKYKYITQCKKRGHFNFQYCFLSN